MTHYAAPSFWRAYHQLPEQVRAIADKQFELLKANPQHPSLHFKRVGRFHSARVGAHCRKGTVSTRAVIRWGGLSLAGGAVAFLGVFTYLAARFNYPEVLDGPAATVLPNLLATGAQGRLVWALYAFLPLIWIPAGVAAYEALASVRRGPMRLAMLFAVVAALAMMLGLMRWPSVHWQLALAWGSAGPGERAVLAAVFDGLNTYLGNYIGEFLGELSFNAFFLLTSIVWLQGPSKHKWIGWFGVGTAAFGLVGMFRNVTGAVAPIAALNNYLLPAFMITLGIALLRWPPVTDSAGA